MEEDNPTSYVTRLVDRVTGIYIEVLSDTEPDAVALIRQKYAIQSDENKSARMRAYIDFWEGLDENQQLSLSSHDAKINHLSRMARVIGTTEVVWAHNSIKATNAGSIDFVLENFRKNGVTAKQVQRFIDENAQAWFSLTGHPTNPTTVEYTLAQIHVAGIISNPEATYEQLKEALRTLRDTPIIGPRKTPLEEAEETLGTLDVLYDSAVRLKNLFENALEKHGYAAEGVIIRKALIHPCVWTLGDGDGNENMTAQVLEEGIALHRKRIAARYAVTGAEIIKRAQSDGIDCEIIKEIEELVRQVQTVKTGRTEEFSLAAEVLAAKLPKCATASALQDLAYLIRCFGRGFGKIDIRHNALDVMDAVAALFHACQLIDKSHFSGMSLDEQSAVLSRYLEDENTLKICSERAVSKLEGEATATRILGRLRVIGQNPDMCEKLIVAETTHPAHALAALLLLKITGNHVGDEHSRIDLVILSESVADLVGIGHTLEVLLENKSFRSHVASRGRLIAMIAKSDTTRQDGRGEAEYAQYEAAVDVYRRVDLMKRKYYELEPVLVTIKNGGGHALQRGGGRVTEIPALHGRAAADARVTDIGPSTLTIQGQQQTIVFCPGKVAVGSLEAFAAQNLYTKAGIQGEMRPPVFSKNINRQYAQADAWLYAKAAGKAFDDLAKNNPAIDELFVAAPWLSMKAGNASSRPAKRGEKHVGVGVTPAEAKGENPKALQGRAISGERLSAHACLPVFSVLGLAEAMEAVKNNGATCVNPEKYGDPLHHLYRAHKIHRDAARATANAVAMADFDIAWPLFTGRRRPHKKQIKKLAVKFVSSSGAYANTPEITLAFLEEYFLKVEKLTYGMVSGQNPKKSMQHGDALKKLWPELAEQVAQRDRSAEFSRVIECYRTRKFDAAPDVPLTQIAFEITQALYASANVINAPVGILATRTRLEPVREVGEKGRTRFMRPQSYQEKNIIHLLQEPAALRNKS
jgi:phosphoenolpyruvate carboxylase